MKSTLLGFVQLDNDCLAADTQRLMGFPRNPGYSEYNLATCPGKENGWWQTWLWNRTGNAQDTDSVEYAESAKVTELGKQLPYISTFLNSTFYMEKAKSVRLFNARNGYIIPHTDYNEFGEGFTRIHIPLLTNRFAMNSEDDTVYHMSVGEIWYVDGRTPHSGGCLGNDTRVHLVMDFQPKTPFEDLCRDKSVLTTERTPTLITREPLTREDMKEIMALSAVINEQNKWDILQILAKVHFNRHVSCSEMYEWQTAICIASRNSDLIKWSRETKALYLGPTF